MSSHLLIKAGAKVLHIHRARDALRVLLFEWPLASRAVCVARNRCMPGGRQWNVSKQSAAAGLKYDATSSAPHDHSPDKPPFTMHLTVQVTKLKGARQLRADGAL